MINARNASYANARSVHLFSVFMLIKLVSMNRAELGSALRSNNFGGKTKALCVDRLSAQFNLDVYY